MADSTLLRASAALPRWARLLLGVATGALMALGQAPYDQWVIALIGLVGAFLLYSQFRAPMVAIGTGWAVGLGYFGMALGWIVEPFMVDAATTGWMAPFGLIGLAGGLALFWALAFWGAAHVSRAPLVALVVFWAAAELARAYVFTGFPWALLAYIWLESPVIQWVSQIGPHGLTLMTLGWVAMVAHAVQRRAPRLAVVTLVTALLILRAGAWLTPPEQDIADRPVLRLVQPNAAQHEKWDPAKIPVFFDRQVTYTAAAPDQGERPALILWPETALPSLLENAGDALRIIARAADGADVVVGVQRQAGGAYFNSLVHMDGDGLLAQVYDKHHLVPFGEYMPAKAFFRQFEIGGLAARAESGYTPGPGPRLLNFGALGAALPLICYEAVFPQDVHRAPARPDWLLQITNDAWFGHFSGPYQHLAQARIRAIEQGLPMARVANTGVSAMIDGAGRVLAFLPLGEAGFLDARLPAPLRVTPYSRSGDLPVLIVLFLSAAGLVFCQLRRSH